MQNLKAMSFDFRKDCVDIIMSGKGGHIGGDMSCMDILIELYYEQMNMNPENQDDPDRVYGFGFAGREIRFRVSGGVLTVIEVL